MDGITAVSGAATAVKAVAQEATETAATTKKEAALGDQQAIRKLARMQKRQRNPQQKRPPKRKKAHLQKVLVRWLICWHSSHLQPRSVSNGRRPQVFGRFHVREFLTAARS